MNEKPIERLNYYNGQRLEADDLKLEQEYHIRVRRWLNKSLYSAGIAHGLEVQADKGNPQQVIVSPGLALDVEGREMILLEEAHIQVVGQKSEKAGEPQGNYLYIQYCEETREEETDYCAPKGNGHKHGQVPWGGPSRVRAEPILGWSYNFPHESSGKVVLAQVELDDKCNVRNVFTYPRHYIGPASNMTVRQYALEGERHIDPQNPGRIYFHIRGRQPNAITLYLRAERFSTLYYSEMGQHKHGSNIEKGSQTGSASGVDSHAHDRGTLIDDAMYHTHSVSAFVSSFKDLDLSNPTSMVPYGPGPIRLPSGTPTPGLSKFMLRLITTIETKSPLPDSTPQLESLTSLETVGMAVSNGAHTQTIIGQTGSTPTSPSPVHTHSYSASIDNAGVTDPSSPPPAHQDYSAHSGAPLKYVDDLQVYVGKLDVDGKRPDDGEDNKFTDEIIAQLKNLQPAIWKNTIDKLGDGTEGHPLANNGTGPIRLDLLSNKLSFPEGQYFIDLVVSSGGGRILYNLYVE